MAGTNVGEGVVHVEEVDGHDAAEQLVEAALQDGGMESPDFGFLFCSPRFDVEEVVSGVHDALSEYGTEFVGGTTSGELSKAGSTFGSAVLLLVDSDEMSFFTGYADGLHDDPVAAGEHAIDTAITDAYLQSDRYRAVFTVMAGLTATQPGVEFKVLEGLSRRLGTDIPVIGGSAADDMRLDQTFQFLNGQVFEDAVVVAAIESDLPIRVGQEHGMNTKLATGVITAVDGKVIREISGRPAAEFYADAIGTTVEDLQDTFEAPSGIELQNVFRYALEKTLADEITPGNLRLFTPIAVTEDGGLDITVELSENTSIYVVEGEDADIISAGRDAFAHISTDEERPIFGVMSDCTCRNTGMGPENAAKEVEQLRDFLQCPVVGFYGYGEIGGTDEAFCTFKNQTISGFVVTEPGQ